MLAEPERVSSGAGPAEVSGGGTATGESGTLLRAGFNPDRLVRIAFAAGIVVLILIGVLSYHSTLVSGDSDEWVRHTRRVSATLDSMLYSMTTNEASGAAYILTGDEAYLNMWRSSTLELQTRAASLHALTQDNPVQQARLPALDALVSQRVKLGARIIDLRRERGLNAAADEIRTGTARNVTVEFRRQVQQMLDEEAILLVQRTATWRANVQTTRTILVTGTILGLLITATAWYGVMRDNARRRRAESALRISEDQYRTLLDEARDYAIFMLDPQGKVMTWNTGAERIKGYSSREIVGSTFSVFFSPEDQKRGRPQEILRATAAQGRHEDQGRRVRRDGSQFVASTVYTALRDPGGNLRGFSEITRDLSETKESGAKYRGLMEAAPDAMVVVNQSGDIVLLNLRAESQFGYRRDELLGQKVSSIVPEGFAERLVADGLRSAEEALAQQIGTGIELTARRKDGTEFPIEIMLSPLRSPEGILITAAIRDISVRKAAETHLAQMERRYRGLLEAAPDAMVVVNQSGKIVLLNLQAERKFGYRRDELLGQKVINIIPEGFAERLIADGLRSPEEALAQHIGTGIELTARRKDGSEFPMELMLSPLGSMGEILVTVAIRDITMRRTAEALLLQKVEELYRSNEELQQFAYIASHDLQEPLRMVASYTTLIARRYKGKLDADADDFIAFAVDGAKRMQRLIQDLLTYSRVGSKGGEFLSTSSEEALEQAIRNLRGALEESGGVVTHDPLPVVLADELQLVQLFQNLIGNAVKYRRDTAPIVHVGVVPCNGRRWLFSVQDNGLGIESQYFERIFGMFQRLHKRDEFAGTGIGLAICKKIVERHGGAMSVESAIGQGSTFRFQMASAPEQACA
jgi:PAS domain S-box-containing protein